MDRKRNKIRFYILLALLVIAGVLLVAALVWDTTNDFAPTVPTNGTLIATDPTPPIETAEANPVPTETLDFGTDVPEEPGPDMTD